jgi:hypothetical protein
MVGHDSENSERPDRLAKLGGPVPPPPALEERIVRSLRNRELLAPSRSNRRLLLGGIAIAATVTAFMLGRLTARAGASEPRWLLLLYEDQSFEAPAPGTEAVRVAEYRAWARATPAVVDGAELGPERYLLAAGRTVEPAPSSSDGIGDLAGYFIIAAPSWAEARAIAARCPHLDHRGRVVVRPLKAD